VLVTLSQIRWIDALDILIVAFGLYQLLLIFKGTRAIPMLMGLVSLYLAAKVSLWAGLLTANWILHNLLGVWVLLIIIVFQPEFRRALANLGQRSSFIRAFSKVEEAHMIDELVRATTSLASKKIGAIMVLERETKLSNYVESGVDIDATLSRRLLESIFFPHSPLHDGAVIINQGRVIAASCFLPLTLNPSVSKDLGTRHRAAIGLTEETDAVAIVISEETGSISLVMDGQITGDLDGAALRRLLGDVLKPKRFR